MGRGKGVGGFATSRTKCCFLRCVPANHPHPQLIQSLPIACHHIAGGISVTLVGHPFDTLKVRLQTQPMDKPIYCECCVGCGAVCVCVLVHFTPARPSFVRFNPAAYIDGYKHPYGTQIMCTGICLPLPSPIIYDPPPSNPTPQPASSTARARRCSGRASGASTRASPPP